MSETTLQTPFDALRRTFVLPEHRQQLAQKEESKISGHAFNIGNFHLVIDTVRHPCEVYEELPLCRLPGSPPHLVGMANQRGNILPIFDLRRMLGYQVEETNRYFLLIGARDEAVGFSIATLPRRIEITADQRITTALPVPHRLEPHIRQFYQQHDQIFADWNVGTFIESLAAEGE